MLFLRITEASQLESYPLKVAIFETMVDIELVKKFTNIGIVPPLFYWRDKTGHKIDVIVDNSNKITPIEIKSGKTINTDFFKHEIYWNKLSQNDNAIILYSSDQEQQRSDGTLVTNRHNINEINF